MSVSKLASSQAPTNCHRDPNDPANFVVEVQPVENYTVTIDGKVYSVPANKVGSQEQAEAAVRRYIAKQSGVIESAQRAARLAVVICSRPCRKARRWALPMKSSVG